MKSMKDRAQHSSSAFRRTMLWLNLFALAGCAASQASLSGLVYDRNGPVSGATVRVQASEVFTTTDASGAFELTALAPDKPVVLTAWASGYYIVAGETPVLPGAPAVRLELIPHAEVDNPDYQWRSAFTSEGDSKNCQDCHSRPGDPDSALPFDEWLLDAHSNAALNERFLTMYAGTDRSGSRSPLTRKGFSRDYGSFPRPPDLSRPYYGPGYRLDFPRTAGNCAACHVPAAAVGAPYAVDPRRVSGVGREGVTCDFCHKVWDVRLDDSGRPYPNMPGVLSFEFRRPPEGHEFFAGPLDDVAPGEDTFSPLQRQSELCAPCHFGVFWDTTVYNSFGEWLDSPYSDSHTGRTCQDCHMPSGLTDHFALADAGGRIRDPETISSHRMRGASDEELLRNAVSMTVDARKEGEELLIRVEVINDNTGHHVPTGSPLRHLILLVQAFDSRRDRLRQLGGPTIPEWGGVGDPAQGHYAGLAGTVYAKVLQEVWTESYPSGAYWNPTRLLSDDRIPALESDRTTYRFSAPKNGDATIEIELIFRRAFIELIEQKGWDAPDIVMARQALALCTAN